MTYQDEITKAMKMLSDNKRTIFLGQCVSYAGCTFGSLSDIPIEKKIELPIMEDTQMGMSIGLALEGYIPVTIYLRMDFLILAMNQIVNHLDKIELMSHGQFKPKVIIRAIVGNKTVLDAGPQHSQDHTDLFRKCLTNINVIKLLNKDKIIWNYRKALESDKSSLMIELRELYDK